jgi:hypothetical protein
MKAHRDLLLRPGSATAQRIDSQARHIRCRADKAETRRASVLHEEARYPGTEGEGRATIMVVMVVVMKKGSLRTSSAQFQMSNLGGGPGSLNRLRPLRGPSSAAIETEIGPAYRG